MNETMKNNLYIISAASMLAFAGCTKDADVEALPVPATQNAKIVLTGISGQTTRTAFGEASQNAVPFLWLSLIHI